MTPAGYARRWVEFLGTRGILAERLLEGTGLTIEALGDRARSISLRATAQLCLNGLVLAGDPAIGLEFGLSLQPTSHGWMGVAVSTAATLRAALDVVERYGAERSGPWHVRWSEQSGRVVIHVEERLPLGPLRPLLFDVLLGGCARLVEVVGGPAALAALDVDLVDFAQAHHTRLAHRLPRLRRGAETAIRFPASWLDLAMPLAEPVTHRDALDALAAEQAALASHDPVDRIRALLAVPSHRFPALEAAARWLGTSSRSLRRHLRARGASFQKLRDEARCAHATMLLASSMLTVDEIADALGYAQATGFVRAFQRWTGMPPSAYRKHMRVSGAKPLHLS